MKLWPGTGWPACHSVSHTVGAAADANHQDLDANPFLRWRVFEDRARCGSIANDLTDANLNWLTHFKSQLGGDLRVDMVVGRPDAIGLRVARALRPLARLPADTADSAGQ